MEIIAIIGFIITIIGFIALLIPIYRKYKFKKIILENYKNYDNYDIAWGFFEKIIIDEKLYFILLNELKTKGKIPKNWYW